ncbi:hypothetical protein DPMN_070023 [Dreissena polymorpha]|uniref:Uncharacterized protein n=1 Tax=Dreissena polymorpha TaxID=45954 RepID=A0A9D4BVD2_DREPO|nr:hypothetical protein DPMN_070023 [Dreissena polymorpha]
MKEDMPILDPADHDFRREHVSIREKSKPNVAMRLYVNIECHVARVIVPVHDKVTVVIQRR